MKKFSQTPRSVLLTKAGWSLIEVGGKDLYTLREDFYDNAVNLMNNGRRPTPTVSPYDIAMSGGEPYAIWN